MNRWKILDNLRRSTYPMMNMLLGAAGWLLIPNAGFWWSAILFSILVFDVGLHAFDSLVMYPSGVGFRGAVRPVLADLRSDLLRSLITL